MTAFLPRLLQTLVFSLIGTTVGIASPSESLQVSHKDDEYVIPLGWLQGGSRAPIELRGADARRSLSLPVPQRLKIDEVKMEMQYTSSISLIPRSQLAVMLDNRVIGQLPLRAEQPDQAARITIPASSFRPGFRTLGFKAAQHYTNECEDPSAPELYTQVDAVESMLHIKTTRLAITPSLARLNDIFDRRLWLDRYTLLMMMPPEAMDTDTELLNAAVQISQSIGAAFEYFPISVRVSELSGSGHLNQKGTNLRFPGVKLPDDAWDAVVLGTRDQLAPYVSQSILNRIKEGYIGIFPSDADPTRAILVISGLTPTQVLQAATLLNIPEVALPDRQDVSISELVLDKDYVHQQSSQSMQGWTSFAQLGFKTTTLQGMYPAPASLKFWAFPEMVDPAEPYIDLELNLAYGAGFDRKSGLNVVLNDQFITAIAMQDPKGQQFFQYRVKIPAISLLPGINELKLLPTVIGLDLGGECRPIFTDNLLVSIFQDSRIKLPPLANFLRLPDLDILAKTGLPYTRSADGFGVGLLITNTHPATLGSAFTLALKLRQVNKAPLFGLRLLTSVQDIDGLNGLIVVGAEESLPEAIRSEMTTFLPKQQWQSVKLGKFESTDLGHGLKRLIEDPLKSVVELSVVEKAASAKIGLSEGLGASTALVQYLSAKHDMPITVLTASNENLLQKGVERLVEHTTWGTLEGAAVLWTSDGEAVAKAFPVVQTFTGKKAKVSGVSYTFSDHPWLLTLVSLLIVLLFASLSWWLLRQRAQRMMEDID